MITSQQFTMDVTGGIAAAEITINGDRYPLVINLRRWPYRWISGDGNTGRRLTLRGAVMAAAHEILIERARDRGASRRGIAQMRIMWGLLEIRGFAERWYARDREIFPHFVESPMGISDGRR